MSKPDNEGQAVALVSGSASGLGRACAERLRGSGYAVAGIDLAPSPVADLPLECDLTDAAAVEAAVAHVLRQLGGLDAVAHCAGIFPKEALPLHAIGIETWERTVAVNLGGSFSLARATLPALTERAGSLVLAASVAATQPQPGAAVYAASKGAVTAFARALALEYAPAGVRVNSISPGWMDTEMAKPALSRPRLRSQIESTIPIGRIADPREVAASVCWLLSDEAAYVTGQDLVIDGGVSVAAFSDPASAAAAWRRIGSRPAD